MENPKIRIESDGIHTEVYINGEKVRAISIEFAHSLNEIAICKIGQYVTDTDGNIVVDENNDFVTQESEIL
jgi:hypothetical protein